MEEIEPDQSLVRLEELRQAGEDYLRQAHARLEEAQERLFRAACEFPDRIRRELASLDRLLHESKQNSERRAAECLHAEVEKIRRRFEECAQVLERQRARAKMQARESEASARRFAEALQVEKPRRIAESGERERLAKESAERKGEILVLRAEL